MAYFQNNNAVERVTHEAFDKTHSPGVEVPLSGIYRCAVCDHEIVSTYGNRLPPQNHHQHPQGQPIRWQLIVVPVHNQKN